MSYNRGKKQSMKKNEKEIPKFIYTMYDNWETLLHQMGKDFEKDFDYTITEGETIGCLGLRIQLKNPKTNRTFSLIVSDDSLDNGELGKRIDYRDSVEGDLTKIGKWIEKRKTKNEKIQNNLSNGKPIQIELMNGVEQNKQYPNSFHIPSDEKKSKVEVGDVVKIVDIQYGERFWVIVKEFISDELMVGEINNQLVGNQPFSLGDKIFLTMDNIIDVLDDDYRKYIKETHPNLLEEGTFDENDNNDELNQKK